MLKTLFSAGPVAIQSISVFVILAFLASGFVFWRKTREEHYDETNTFDGFLLAWVVGLIWARVGFVVLNIEQLGFNVFSWLDVVSRPGLNALFGVAGASLYLYQFAKKRKWDAFEILDYWFLAVSQGLIWVWIGLFLDGSRFGVATSLPVGIVFPGVFEPHHPTQLYAAGLYALLFAYLAWLEYHYRTFEWYKAKRKSAQSGFMTAVFLMGHGLISAGLAWIMPANVLVRGFELDYVLAGLSFVLGLIVIIVRSGRVPHVFKKRS